MMTGILGIWIIQLIIIAVLVGLVIYALVLAIVALKIYINKNRNYKQ
ncbi:hypothetical protein [Anaerocolumna xylanovorans]|uniref:Uncharacterized protein n=1 Tax=Anaerocolumna xylanovorans DSM 12503 TaxID=1121345 RepID=A0A1M7YEQ8_9FIRM|nr:hypothetical protein [Anaerocolumna xylanovorans]SHO51093.1 hypothetical protein SAMN02745217_03014 [Anaerocolumna xylanovorans DSM 12503]